MKYNVINGEENLNEIEALHQNLFEISKFEFESMLNDVTCCDMESIEKQLSDISLTRELTDAEDTVRGICVSTMSHTYDPDKWDEDHYYESYDYDDEDDYEDEEYE